MPRDMHERGYVAAPQADPVRSASARRRTPSWLRWLRLDLPAKLLLLTAAFVMLAEVLIFVPSIASFRVNWLSDRLTAAQLAALASEAVPGGQVPPELTIDLLRTAQVRAIATKREGMRHLVLSSDGTMMIDAHFDLRRPPSESAWQVVRMWTGLIGDAVGTLLAGNGRVIRVLGPFGPAPEDFIEIVLPDTPLRAAMLTYSLNVLALSVIISLVTAALVYLALSRLLVAPMMRITRNMLYFSQNPEDASRIITPSARTDEVGTAERQLAQMQQQLAQLLLQKNRLAQLGLAVSKINHDLRNMLANAQLISDRLTAVPDPTVQRFAPKLIASLDRAINFCNDSLKFGRAEEAAPRRDLMRLKSLVEEVGDGLGLPVEGRIDWVVDIDDMLRIDADREHLFRIVSNLVRNAVQAIESLDEAKPGEIRVAARREGRRVFIEVRDTGPGIPPRARENLFRAFQGSSKKGSTGLGLAIASELVAAHGGSLELLDTARGAGFRIELPDRSTTC